MKPNKTWIIEQIIKINLEPGAKARFLKLSGTPGKRVPFLSWGGAAVPVCGRFTSSVPQDGVLYWGSGPHPLCQNVVGGQKQLETQMQSLRYPDHMPNRAL